MNLVPRRIGSIEWLALRRQVPPERSWEIDEGKFWGLAFSRDGKKIAYAAHADGRCEVRVVGADGRGMDVVASTRADELVTEMHGFSEGDRHLLYGIARSGAEPELWAADLAHPADATGDEVDLGRERRMARGYFFAGWADAYDAFYAWERATTGRRTFRIGFDGGIAQVHSRRLDRTVALSADGESVFFSEKLDGDASDRRFLLCRESLDGSHREVIAEIATSCFARRVAVTLSPCGRYLHASAVGPADGAGEQLLAFDLVVATDGSFRRPLAAKGWAWNDRAVVAGEGRSLLMANLRTGAILPFIDQAVDHFALSHDGRRCAWVSGRSLRVCAIPA